MIMIMIMNIIIIKAIYIKRRIAYGHNCAMSAAEMSIV